MKKGIKISHNREARTMLYLSGLKTRKSMLHAERGANVGRKVRFRTPTSPTFLSFH